MARKSFSKRLSWNVIAIVSVIFIVMLFIVSWASTRLTEAEATRSAQYMLHGTISELEQPLTELEVQTRTIALHVSMQINNTDNLDKISNYVVSTSSLINGCSILIPAKDNKEDIICCRRR